MIFRVLAALLLAAAPVGAFVPMSPGTTPLVGGEISQYQGVEPPPADCNDAAGYVGPGDCASYTAWWGLRAYSAAVAATGTQAAVDLRRVSDSATCTALIGTSGDLDLTVGTPCGGSTVTAWIGASTATVSKIYDQTNGSACSAASCDLVQATTSRQPQLLLTGGGGSGTRPYLSKNAGNDGAMVGANNFIPNAAFEMSLSIMASRNTSNTSRFLRSNSNGGTDGIGMTTIGGTEAWGLSGCLVAATDSVWHAGNGRAANGVINGTTFNVDGVEGVCITSIGDNAGVGAPPQILNPVGIGAAVMLFGEGGFADNALWSSGLRTSLCHNQRLYWGTPGTC